MTVDPIICLVDSKTPPPDQTETSCPEVPAQPTRLRVILPFAGTNANFFAKSILLGWDYVPAPANSTLGVRTFQVRLHQFTRIDNGGSNDWRIFVNVGGQWRYLSSVFDTDAYNGGGISGLDGGNNVCHMDPVKRAITRLTEAPRWGLWPKTTVTTTAKPNIAFLLIGHRSRSPLVPLGIFRERGFMNKSDSN